MSTEAPRARLSNATLGNLRQGTLAQDILRPRYDRSALKTGIVHLGVGAFHRAHQAVYTEAALAAGDLRWGITGVSLRNPDMRDALMPQDGLYTVAERASDGERLHVVGALRDILVAPENPAAVLARLVAPEVAIVSITVTEKGYCHDPATGELDEAHPDIVHDLAHPDAPRSLPGYLLRAIALRRSEGHAPFTIMSCDNLSENGQTTRRVLMRFAQLAAPELVGYIANEIACPDTMVDRIVPATTDADRARIADAIGLTDAWPVVTEPFSQWVIEDHFPAGRPDWASAGATLSHDVPAFEAMKLRLLNGSHSAIAYLGQLAGYETVADAIADPGIAGFIDRLMDEAAVTLRLPAEVDIGSYRRSLIERFGNTALDHRTAQIASDGSQKLPPRVLNPIRDRLARGLPVQAHALVVAAWMRFVSRAEVLDNPTLLRDPLAEQITTIARRTSGESEQLVEGLLSLKPIFGDDLPATPLFRTAVVNALNSLQRTDARGTAALYGRRGEADA